MPKNKLIPHKHLLIIVLFSCVMLAPAFILGAGGGDLHCQSLWVKFFNEQFWNGDLYPRWLQGMYVGDGSPVFFYYPPLPYFITAFFTFLSSFDAFNYYPIAASACLAAIISGITFYIWLKDEDISGEAALIGSLLYIAAPFHIAQNFYYTLLFSSVWSYAWIPLLLLFAKRMTFGKPYSIAGFAVALCMLVMTNLPMTLIFGPIAVAYAAANFHKEHFSKQSLKLGIAVILGFALSAVYLLPSLLYMDYANVDIHWKMPGHKGGYSSYFLPLGFSTISQILFTCLWLISATLPFMYFKSVKPKRREIFFFLVLAASLFMILPISQFVWKMLPIVQILQNPLRFFAVPALCLALFAAIVFPRFKILAYGLLVIYVGITFAIAGTTRVSVESFSKSEPERYEQYMLGIDQYANYLTTPNLILRYYMPEGFADVKTHREKVEVVNGDAKIDAIEWKPRNIVLHYNASRDSTLRVRQFDFPGWQVLYNGRELDKKRDENTGEIMFDVAEGEGNITLQLTKLLPEIAGKMISILSAAILVLMFLIELRNTKGVIVEKKRKWKKA